MQQLYTQSLELAIKKQNKKRPERVRFKLLHASRAAVLVSALKVRFSCSAVPWVGEVSARPTACCRYTPSPSSGSPPWPPSRCWPPLGSRPAGRRSSASTRSSSGAPEHCESFSCRNPRCQTFAGSSTCGCCWSVWGPCCGRRCRSPASASWQPAARASWRDGQRNYAGGWRRGISSAQAGWGASSLTGWGRSVSPPVSSPPWPRQSPPLPPGPPHHRHHLHLLQHKINPAKINLSHLSSAVVTPPGCTLLDRTLFTTIFHIVWPSDAAAVPSS